MYAASLLKNMLLNRQTNISIKKLKKKPLGYCLLKKKYLSKKLNFGIIFFSSIIK